jgi:hypothetical protein
MSNPLISRLQSIADVAEYLHKSLADPDSGGGVRSPGRAAEAGEKAIFLLKHGAPLTPQDLPAYAAFPQYSFSSKANELLAGSMPRIVQQMEWMIASCWYALTVRYASELPVDACLSQLEDAVKFMSRLPPGNAVATWLEHQFIDLCTCAIL